MNDSNNQNGIITPLILVITSIMLIFAVALINWSVTEHKNAQKKIRTNQALQIAEAGINYYKWHLEHNDKDYQDEKDWCCNNDPSLSLAYCGYVCGPYDHNYRDYCSGSDCEGDLIGQFSLRITPPETGSTIVSVESIGRAYDDVDNKKKITARVGKRSLAEYSWLSQAPMTFSATSTVTGPVHSNNRIEFRGVCGAEITSSCCVNPETDGVWGAGGPKSFWRWPVPIVDFDDFKTDLWNIKKQAAVDDAPEGETGTCSGDSGEGRGICYENSGAAGYLVIFGGNVGGMTGDATVSIYRADSLEARVKYRDWGIKQEAEEVDLDHITPLLENHALPDNGLIFLEDDVWVEGVVDGKITIGATKFLDGAARIRINNNITYADNRAGGDNLGLISQGDILIPRHAPTDLTIEASLLSQEGKGLFFRNYKTKIVKSRVENYGGIVTYKRAGVKYINWWGAVVNGYTDSYYTYNNNLTFSPPPYFPTAKNFEVLSWSEE